MLSKSITDITQNADGTVSFTFHLTNFVKGDANDDLVVNAADIVEVVNYIMGNPSAAFNFSAADVNGDGSVNAADIVLIVNLILAGT
jgi:pectinesterase